MTEISVKLDVSKYPSEVSEFLFRLSQNDMPKVVLPDGLLSHEEQDFYRSPAIYFTNDIARVYAEQNEGFFFPSRAERQHQEFLFSHLVGAMKAIHVREAGSFQENKLKGYEVNAEKTRMGIQEAALDVWEENLPFLRTVKVVEKFPLEIRGPDEVFSFVGEFYGDETSVGRSIDVYHRSEDGFLRKDQEGAVLRNPYKVHLSITPEQSELERYRRGPRIASMQLHTHLNPDFWKSLGHERFRSASGIEEFVQSHGVDFRRARFGNLRPEEEAFIYTVGGSEPLKDQVRKFTEVVHRVHKGLWDIEGRAQDLQYQEPEFYENQNLD